MTLNLPQLIYDQMLASDEKHEWKQHWYPSGIGAECTNDKGEQEHIGKCRRALYFDLTHTEKTNPMDAPALFKCNVGDLIHDYLDKLLATQLVKEGYELQNINGSEIPIAWTPDGCEFEFSGRMDYLFKRPDGKYVAVEWKSTYGRGFDMIKKNGAKIENLLQCCCYLNQNVYPLEEILLLYAGRDNGYIIGFAVSKCEQGLKLERMGTNEVTFCPLKFEDIIKSCQTVEKCVKEQILPKRDYTEKDWQCSYCSYRDHCKKLQSEIDATEGQV